MFPISIPPIAAAMLLACALVASAQERVPFFDDDRKQPETTMSPDGDFVVNGSDAHTRGVYSEFAVEARKDFQGLMNFQSALKFPVVIDLSEAPGNRFAGYPVQRVARALPPSFDYSPHLEVTLCESLRMASVRENLVWCFLIDYAVRNNVEPGRIVEKRGSVMIPDWLWAGAAEAIGFKEAGEPSELFAAVFESGQLMSVEEILKADPSRMSSLSRAIYRASAGGLVLTLLQQQDGPTRMRRFIDALAVAPPDQEALLKSHFPGIDDSNNSLEKWWALQVAQLAKPTSLDIFTIKETEERLRRALVVAVLEDQNTDDGEGDRRRPRLRLFKKRDADMGNPGDAEAPAAAPVPQERVTYELGDYRYFEDRDDLADVLHQNELRLVQLSYRSFPLHRPLIKEYLELIKAIEKGDTKRIDERFGRLAKTRVGLLRSGEMAEDVMNLHSATEADQSSGEFDGYFKLFDHLRNTKPVRRDEITDYLDRVQAEVE